ncbi:MAG: twin-arginine translocase subunit TatC [Candidatus Sedimenticola sp. PURPLELP]
MTQSNDPADSSSLAEQPFVSHLIELRDRLLRAVVAIIIIFLVLFPFANDIYQVISAPLLAKLPQGDQMIATGVISPFLAPFKLALVAAIFLAMPFLLYQLWSFIAPGLYKHEKRVLIPMVGSSALLFYLGSAFAFYVVFPLVFAFMVATTPDGVNMAPDITQYLEFVLTLFFAFGLAFEVPIATIILVWMGMTTPESLSNKRPYIIVGAFCIGMLLTPPDVISQTLLALPMWVLFEVGLFFSRIVYRDRQKRKAAEDAEYEAESTPEEKAAPAAATAAPATAGSADFFDGDLTPEEMDKAVDPDRFVPLTEDELDAELDAIEAEEEDDFDEADLGENDDGGMSDELFEEKLRLVKELRDQEEETKARGVLYELLGHADDEQAKVVRNILSQLDGEGWS